MAVRSDGFPPTPLPHQVTRASFGLLADGHRHPHRLRLAAFGMHLSEGGQVTSDTQPWWTGDVSF